MPLAFADRRGVPFSLFLQEPAIVFKDRLAWLGVRKYLDPAPDSEKAGNPTQQNWLFQFFAQLLA